MCACVLACVRVYVCVCVLVRLCGWMDAYLHVVPPGRPAASWLTKCLCRGPSLCQSSVWKWRLLSKQPRNHNAHTKKDYSIKSTCPAGTGMPTSAAVRRQVKTANSPFTPAPEKKKITLASWNVHTLLRPESKPLLTDSLCNRAKTVACLQETRLPGDNACVIQDSNGMPSYRLFASGEEKYGLHGVGIAIQLKLANCVMSWRPFGPRLCHLRLSAKPFPIFLISACSPTEDADPYVKETFHMHLNDLLDSIPKKDFLLLAGVWNAKLSTPPPTD